MLEMKKKRDNIFFLEAIHSALSSDTTYSPAHP
jgi:hypothetical protein